MAYAGKTGGARPLRAAPNLPARQTLPPAPAADKGGLTLASGLVIGLLVGVGMALLFAPQSGAETRHDIGRRFRKARRRGHDAWEDLGDELRRARRELRRLRRRRRARAEEAGAADSR